MNSWNSSKDGIAAGLYLTLKAGVTGLILLGWDVWPVGPRIPHGVYFTEAESEASSGNRYVTSSREGFVL